ncbi:MAG: phosphoribosylformylglycinamidine cyclo-ligase [Gaiellaceae bacterium]|jgi:phosphoribosylformylglycinamidine cyclo-ligase
MSYEAAGVSLAKAEEIVERLRGAVTSTQARASSGAFGAFAGLYELDDTRLLAASTDGVGTKLILQRASGHLRWGGMDVAAHCINDVLTTGAEPLFFLDYFASDRIELELVTELVEGAAQTCRENGCVLLGGETAELPGIYAAGELDFAGTCVGMVERERLIDGPASCRPGDVVLGLRSAGLHANGFTLVRQLVGSEEFDSDLLLPPTLCYLEDVRKLRERADVHALAHVTGGGIPGNLARVLPPGIGARIETGSWERGAVYDWVSEKGVSEEEQRRVFNLGIGYCAVIPEADASPSDLVIGRLESDLQGVVFT